MDRRTAFVTVAVLGVTALVIAGLIVRQADRDDPPNASGDPSGAEAPDSLPEPSGAADPEVAPEPSVGDDPDVAPEPSGGEDPDVAPEPSGGDDPATTLEAFVDEAVAFIEATRGMAFIERPEVVTLADSEFVARLDADLAEAFAEDPDALAIFNAAYRAFDLIGPDEGIDEVYRAFGAVGVLGFYDPETDELVVRQVDDLSLLTKSAIVHELVHAFDDQHFDIDRPEYDDRTDEIPWTFAAVREGSASHVQTLWEKRLARADQAALLDEELGLADPSVLTRFELSFLWLEVSPYVEGEAFVAEVVERGGFAALAGLLVDPPATSEQVMDSNAFLAAEVGTGVRTPPADGDVVTEGVGGQVLLDALFTGNAIDFGRAADGWGDDRYVIWLAGDRTCLRWDVRADTPTDLAEIETALDAWVARRSGTVSSPDPDTVRVERCV